MAKEWTVERFQKCIRADMGDELSLARQVSSERCRTMSVVTKSQGGPDSLSADAHFKAVKAGAEAPWQFVLLLQGNFARVRSPLVGDARHSSRIQQVRAKIGPSVVDMEPKASDARVSDCAGQRVLGMYVSSCTYLFAAAFEVLPEHLVTARAAWVSDPKAVIPFRAFMSEGEQFDGEIMAAELVAVADAIRSR